MLLKGGRFKAGESYSLLAFDDHLVTMPSRGLICIRRQDAAARSDLITHLGTEGCGSVWCRALS